MIAQRRHWGWAMAWIVGLLWAWWAAPTPALAEQDNWTVPPGPPRLINGRMECADGFYAMTNPENIAIGVPNGWTPLFIVGQPEMNSTRLRYHEGRCDESEYPFIERTRGDNNLDSLVILADDLEWSDAPGKPFDLVLYQQVAATYGAAYSVSAWMVSLCGNKSKPFDCPPENYIVKGVGLDPLGGTDPFTSTVRWVENRVNFVDSRGKSTGYQNLRASVTALGPTITVFLRVYSPFQFHGNMAFVDEVVLTRAPLARLQALPPQVEGTRSLTVTWEGQMSADIAAIPRSTHQLHFDVQARVLPEQMWRDVVVDRVGEGSATFVAPCAARMYALRVRARAEQPPAPPEGASPNHRFEGVWSAEQRVYFAPAPPPDTFPTTYQLYLPSAQRGGSC